MHPLKTHLAVTITLCTTFMSANASRPIGSIYTHEPEANCEFGVGHVIENLPEHVLDYYVCDGRAEVWLSQVIKQPSLGVGQTKNDSEYQVVDYLFLGTLSDQEFIDPPRCTERNSKTPVQMVGIFRRHPNNKPVYTHKNGGLLQAWVVNSSTRRLEFMQKSQLAKIVCKSEEE